MWYRWFEYVWAIDSYAVVFDASDVFGSIVPTSCDVGYEYTVGIRRLDA